MKNGYNLNVALNGRHFCNVQLGEMYPQADAVERAKDIAARFPVTDGFECRLTRWQASGEYIGI